MTLTQDQHDDLQHLMQTARWPYWPYCPMLRGDEQGFVFDGPNGQCIMYHGNLFTVIHDAVDLNTLSQKIYNNSYETIQDGWRVD